MFNDVIIRDNVDNGDDDLVEWLLDHDFWEDDDTYVQLTLDDDALATVRVMRTVKTYSIAGRTHSRPDGTYSYCIRGLEDEDEGNEVLPLRSLDHLKKVYKATLI